MPLTYDEFDKRVDAIVAAFNAVRGSTLRQHLPHEVTVFKGPYRENEPSAGNFEASRNRLAFWPADGSR